MRRILYIDPSADVSGAEKSLLALLRGLDRSRYEPLLICPGEGRLSQRAGALSVRYELVPIQQLSLTGSPLDVLRDLSRMLPASKRWRDVIVREKIDLVHVNSYRIAVPVSLGARLAGRPVIWHVRDIPTSPSRRRLASFLARHLANRVIAVSCAVAEVFERGTTGRAKVRVIYNGIDTSAFRATAGRETTRSSLGITPDTVLIGAVGQLVPWKGYEILLQAMRMLTDWNVPVAAWIVGETISPGFRIPSGWDTYKDRLIDLQKELGLEKRVKFLGFRDDIPDLMAAFDIYAHTAVSPDPLPRSILEAMASGLAIVAPATGGIPEQIAHDESGWLYPAGQVKALAGALAALVCDPKKRHELGQAAEQRCRSVFSLDSHVRQVQSLYDEVLASEGRRSLP